MLVRKLDRAPRWKCSARRYKTRWRQWATRRQWCSHRCLRHRPGRPTSWELGGGGAEDVVVSIPIWKNPGLKVEKVWESLDSWLQELNKLRFGKIQWDKGDHLSLKTVNNCRSHTVPYLLVGTLQIQNNWLTNREASDNLIYNQSYIIWLSPQTSTFVGFLPYVAPIWSAPNRLLPSNPGKKCQGLDDAIAIHGEEQFDGANPELPAAQTGLRYSSLPVTAAMAIRKKNMDTKQCQLDKNETRWNKMVCSDWLFNWIFREHLEDPKVFSKLEVCKLWTMIDPNFMYGISVPEKDSPLTVTAKKSFKTWCVTYFTDFMSNLSFHFYQAKHWPRFSTTQGPPVTWPGTAGICLKILREYRRKHA